MIIPSRQYISLKSISFVLFFLGLNISGFSQNEICNNGIDDDGDGWVDSFDPDCPEHDSLYMAQPDVECNSVWETSDFSMKLGWRSNKNIEIDSRTTPKIGDINSDGKLEVLLPYHDTNPDYKIAIFNASDGILNRTITMYGITRSGGGSPELSIADIDNDGNSEIFFVIKNRNNDYFLTCINLTGSLLWSSRLNRENGQGVAMVSGICDFNQDGIPEIYVGSQIFNALTGILLLEGNDGTGGGWDSKLSVAGDVLPNTPGLELVAGNTVYELNIINPNGLAGNTFISHIVAGNKPDGFTGLADFDSDGLLDVVVIQAELSSRNKLIYIWNPRTKTVMAQRYMNLQFGSFPFIGDVNGDCIPEIGATYGNKLVLFEYNNTTNLNILYQLNTTDRSGSTSVTMFDFNQDGKQELMYRDETHLRILNGIDGLELIKFPCTSATWFESPIVADVDLDGQAEILVTGGYDSLNNWVGNVLNCFESDINTWAPARSVWNQQAYHVTNINDDLTVPREQQNIAQKRDDYCDCQAPYNAMMTQATYRTRRGCPINPATDISLDLLDVYCDNDSLCLEYQISNNSDKIDIPDSVQVAIYDNNPLNGNAKLLGSYSIGIQVNSLTTGPVVKLKIHADSIIGHLYAVANISGNEVIPFDLPTTNLNECDYTNNIDSLAYIYRTGPINLGPDIIVCSDQRTTLSVPLGYASYKWSDGSTSQSLSTNNTGEFWVEVTDACNNVFTDTMEITLDQSISVEILANSTFCESDTIHLSSNGNFNSYQWTGVPDSLCLDCSDLIVIAEDDLSVKLLVEFREDCFISDSINIQVLDSFLIHESHHLCPGDSILVGPNWIKHDTTIIRSLLTQDFCDSTIISDIIFSVASQELNLGPDTNFCYMDTIILGSNDIFDSYLWQDGSRQATLEVSSPGIYILSAFDACLIEYADTIELRLDSTYYLEILGDSTICLFDSISLRSNLAYDNIDWLNQGTVICQNCSGLNIPIVENTTIEIQVRNDNGCSNAEIKEISILDTALIFQNFLLCNDDSIFIENGWINTVGTYSYFYSNKNGCDSTIIISLREFNQEYDYSFDIDCDKQLVSTMIESLNNITVNWEDGQNGQSAQFEGGSQVNVSIIDDGSNCKTELTIDIPIIPNAGNILNWTDTTLLDGTPFEIDLGLDPLTWQVTWSPDNAVSCSNCTKTTIAPFTEQVTIEIYHTETGCTYSVKINMIWKDGIFIPNTFSPNEDGHNDLWQFYYTDNIKSVRSVKIFNRWGDFVLDWNGNGRFTWNGYFNDKPANQGVYVYIAEFEHKDGRLIQKSGDFTIVR